MQWDRLLVASRGYKTGKEKYFGMEEIYDDYSYIWCLILGAPQFNNFMVKDYSMFTRMRSGK